MNLLFLGDIVASPGRLALTDLLPSLRDELSLDCVIANGENAAHGRGITLETMQEIFAAGVDVITLGDHTFDQKGVEDLLAGQPRLLRPANYPPGTVGRGHTIYTIKSGPNAGKKVGVVNLQGRVFINQVTDNAFTVARQIMKDLRLGDTVDALVVDMHAEATSEKVCMGHLWDGKASLVVGTHTHIPTADTRIQPGGTAYQTDAGMCGDYHSSLGVSFQSVFPSYEYRGRFMFQPATGPATLSGVMVKTGDNGLATEVRPVRRGGVLPQA